MDVTQIYSLTNDSVREVLGETAVLQEDLSNVVDMGTAIANANAYDKYVKSLVNHIGKVIFVIRAYKGGVPKVLMDGWEFGSILEKIQMDMPQATENESWELNDGTSYDPNIFYKPTVSAKFFNKKVTFEVPISITELQVKQSFSNPTQLNSFLSMIYNAVDKAMTVRIENLVMKTINNMIGETVFDCYGSGAQTTAGNARAINLLSIYNTKFSQSLTAAAAITDKEFLRFAALTMKLYIKRLSRISTLFNVGGKERFTPKDLLHVVLLSDFVVGAEMYLQSDTFHNTLVELPNYEEVPYWQGSGVDYSFDEISKIDIISGGNNTITVSGILGIMFDRDALGVCNRDRRTTTNYNPKAEFWNNWYKFDAHYFNDLNENFIVFFVA